MTQIWLTTEEVVELMGITERHFRRIADHFTTRPGRKAGNGRARREILLSSLPAEMQAAYLEIRSFAGAQDDRKNSFPGLARPGAESNGGASRAGAGANLPPALLSTAALIVNRYSSIENPLVGLSEEKLKGITEYADLLNRAEGQSRQQRRWLARRAEVSLATLDRDIKALRAAGMAALAPKRRADVGRSRVAPRGIIARVQTEYLKPHRPAASEIYRSLAREYRAKGQRAPSYAFVVRTCKATAPDLVARFRIGEKYYDDNFAYYTQRKKPALPRQWVDADHHPCDHYVIFPDGSIGRPWLTAIQDICTNEILGFRLTKFKPVGRGSYPGANTIALTLRHAILRKTDPSRSAQDDKDWPSYGLFENFYADLGRDFRSHHIRAICHDLTINIRHTRGYHGKSKPIERWFGVMELPLGRLPGYCGNSPGNNPYRQRIGPPRKPEEMRNELLTIEQYETAIYDWIVKEFHHRESRALKGLSPMAALEAHVKNGFVAREVRDERVLDLLLMRANKKKPVGRRGIQMFGTKYEPRHYGAPELLDLVGQEVEVAWDPAAIGQVVVYKDTRFLCIAVNRELSEFGASEETIRREREIRREQEQRQQERYQEMVNQARYPRAIDQARAEQRDELMIEEERRQIAVGAQAPGAAMLLPKQQRAVKLLSKKKLREKARYVFSEVKRQKSPSLLTPHSSLPEEPEWMKEEEPVAEPVKEKPQWLRELEREEEDDGE